MMSKKINGFSKLSKTKKIDWIAKTHFKNPEKARKELERNWNLDKKIQTVYDEFIENSVTNFYLPFGVAPNFLINEKYYTLPMVTEESSVVAAASNAAKFWCQRGGFKTRIINTIKVGQVHLMYKGNPERLKSFFDNRKNDFINSTKSITKNMEARGGGIISIDLVDKSNILPNYFQLDLRFKTAESMGANFINSCLESIANDFMTHAENDNLINEKKQDLEIVMSILSNYVPECLVNVMVMCNLEEFILEENTFDGYNFAKKIVNASKIANVEPYRAVTNNKGIMNGVDALIIATGNDFRAIEAGAHAYASRSGQYRSLSKAYIENDQFIMELTLPIAVGTVGGLTNLHPMVNWSLELLGNPNVEDLMSIIASAGLAQNFAALKSLVTTGIQKGHMKMHLLNILNQFKADNSQKIAAKNYFKNKTVSVSAVKKFLDENVF